MAVDLDVLGLSVVRTAESLKLQSQELRPDAW